MRYPSTIQIAAIERFVVREDFSEPYHRVTFDLVSDGIPASQLVIWVHPAFPDDDLVRVAHTFAWSRLAALTEAASSNVFSADQIQALWERVQPADFAAQ
ncbi:MAG: hypothetical protein AAGH67_03820 [Cyanobacteria bacterium P01_H01_bin.162]